MINKANEPAFPTEEVSFDGKGVSGGLTKRELIAAMAMQGLISTLTIGRDEQCDYMAEVAVKYADALLAKLNEEKRDE